VTGNDHTAISRPSLSLSEIEGAVRASAITYAFPRGLHYSSTTPPVRKFFQIFLASVEISRNL